MGIWRDGINFFFVWWTSISVRLTRTVKWHIYTVYVDAMAQNAYGISRLSVLWANEHESKRERKITMIQIVFGRCEIKVKHQPHFIALSSSGREREKLLWHIINSKYVYICHKRFHRMYCIPYIQFVWEFYLIVFLCCQNYCRPFCVHFDCGTFFSSGFGLARFGLLTIYWHLLEIRATRGIKEHTIKS